MDLSFVFIRHAESLHNQRVAELEKKLGTPDIKRTPQYKEIKYSEELIDAGISERGRVDTLVTKNSLKIEEISTVIVSPLRRALQTCDIIFGDRKDIQVIVEPLLTEQMSSAVDVGGRLKESQQIYAGKFDFSRIKEGDEDRWYLDQILSQECRKKIQTAAAESNLAIQQATLQVMKGQVLESKQKLQERIKLSKQRLGQYQSGAKGKVAVVGHSYMIRAITAKGFNADGSTIDGVMLENSEAREISISLEGKQL